jgi:hypothetical protein
VFTGAEEFVDLLEELSAGAVVFVIDDDINTVSGSLDSGSQSGRTGADTYHFTSSHGLPPGQIRPVAVLRFNLHAFFEGLDTGANVGSAVDHHDAIRAAPDRTEHAPGFVSPGSVTVNQYTVASQGNGDGFAFKTLHGLPVKGKPDFFALFKSSQNGVFFYAHDDLPRLIKMPEI